MKRTLLLTALLLAASASQAKIQCNVNSGSLKQKMIYDKMLFTGEVTMGKPRYFVIDQSGSSAREIQPAQFTTFGIWEAIDGLTMVSLSLAEDGRSGITVGPIDVSKAQGNALPLEAIAFGAVTDTQSLNLVVPTRNLSIICASSNR